MKNKKKGILIVILFLCFISGCTNTKDEIQIHYASSKRYADGGIYKIIETYIEQYSKEQKDNDITCVRYAGDAESDALKEVLSISNDIVLLEVLQTQGSDEVITYYYVMVNNDGTWEIDYSNSGPVDSYVLF